jgi:chemotaxis protein MotB
MRRDVATAEWVTTMRRVRSSEEPVRVNWLTTYGDMVTLLMTFFILLFALSMMNQSKFSKAAGSLQTSFGGGTGILPGAPAMPLDPAPVIRLTKDEAQLNEVMSQISKFVEANNLTDEVQVGADSRGLLIRFKDRLLFDAGKADLKPESRAVLDSVRDAIAGIPNAVRIEGHTDDVPISTSRFPSNWDLSVARAVSVLQWMGRDNRISKGRLSVAGYGEYRPAGDNSTEAGRRLNRRVDVVVLSLEQTAIEPK